MPFDSKTVLGLIFLLAVIVLLACINKLSPEAVDAIKWVGTAYMSVRVVANHVEGKYGSKQD